MKKDRSVKQRLFSAILVLVMLFTSLLGTTFAWFTDQVSSAGNQIVSGTLKVDLLHKTDDDWISLKQKPAHKIFDYAHWEPGYTRVEALKVENLGTLALQYKLALSIAPGSEKTGPNGENLADVIHVYYTNAEANPANFAEIKDTWTHAGTLTKVMESPATFIGGQLTPEGKQGDEQIYSIALHMDETAGNEYQNLSVGNIYVNLVATQWTYESDSFDENYDKDATFPGEFSASASVSVDANGEVVQAATVGEQDGIHADVPAGVQMANGATELTLDIQPMGGSQANITLDNGETKKSYDIHMDGIATDNTVPVQITLPGFMKKGLNSTSVKLYHVENGQTVAMKLVSNPVNHNEFSYDPATGDVVVAMATFSEVVAVENVANQWDGQTATAYTGSGTEADPYLISNAEQFAYFRNQVDGGKDFKDEFVKLNGDIDLNKKNFDPIGWGYVNASHNRNSADGKVFKGTFDGAGYSILNLYQNGWDLESATGTDYTYTNCGFGLFAAASGATFKNLTMLGADIRVECVETGVLVGLSQNSCTYENIKIYDSKIANYQRPAGGLIGEVSGTGTTKISNVTVGANVVVGSLWGDFDAPVGGVIGARWDDVDADPRIEMTDVTVAARLDVYNDVTSTYQWYAYRRAGMLIGNTDTAETQDGRTVATATFLTCENVKVYYGNWVNYHYCEFNNYEPRWPFVRVESGENCSAYSNPRYGVPNSANGVKVVNQYHTHKEGDTCMLLLEFDQLYGGGQGVYGATEHTGVTIQDFSYSAIYMDAEGKTVYGEDYVLSNANDFKVGTNVTPVAPAPNKVFVGWVNTNSAVIDSIQAGNAKNVVLYASWQNPYTIRFVDKDGNVIYYEVWTSSTQGLTKPPEVPEIAGYVGSWEDGWETKLQNVTSDVTIKPIYVLKEYADEENKEEHVVGDSNMTAELLFQYLGEGKSVVMGMDLEHAGGNLNGNTNNLCDIDTTTARLNLNSCELTCNFSHNAAKEWHVFGFANNGSKLTITGGVNGEGTLRMNITDMNQNAYAYIFNLVPESTLVLEAGVTIEVHYPTANQGKVFAFAFADEKGNVKSTTDFSNDDSIYVDKTTAGVIRIVVGIDTVITGDGNISHP